MYLLSSFIAIPRAVKPAARKETVRAADDPNPVFFVASFGTENGFYFASLPGN